MVRVQLTAWWHSLIQSSNYPSSRTQSDTHCIGLSTITYVYFLLTDAGVPIFKLNFQDTVQ